MGLRRVGEKGPDLGKAEGLDMGTSGQAKHNSSSDLILSPGVLGAGGLQACRVGFLDTGGEDTISPVHL